MDFQDGIGMIAKAREKETRKEFWDMYIARVPLMDEKTFVSFDDYYGKRNTKAVTNNAPPVKHYSKSDVPEIIQMAELIKKADEKSRKNNKEGE